MFETYCTALIEDSPSVAVVAFRHGDRMVPGGLA
jgi:hypothetical protein